MMKNIQQKRQQNGNNKNDDNNNNNDSLIDQRSSSQEFIISDRFDDQDFHRPDVPDWYFHRYQTKSVDGSDENEKKFFNEKILQQNKSEKPFKAPIVWRNVFAMIVLHSLGAYGFYVGLRQARWQSLVWSWLISAVGSFGVLAGAHRLWTHRSYKAHWSLRVVLMILHTVCLQNDLYEWCRDHRTHHKYSETDADPHNSRRGFFFAHMGWLLCRKHPDVKAKGSLIDMSDVWADPVVRFQRRFYIPLALLLWGIVPVLIPVYGWGEDFWLAVMGNFFRYVMSLHHTWTVNSWAHMYGYQFFDQSVQPRENYLVTYLTYGEGYHNYHHVFPWDYSASEHGWRHCFSPATAFIDFCAWLGLAYDRRIVSRTLIQQRIQRCGDIKTVPSFMEKQRKPKRIMIEYLLGMIATTWPLIVFLVLRMIIQSY